MKVEDWKARYLILAFDCSITFGCYFNVDIISALQTDIQGKDTGNCTTITGNETCCEGCLGLGPDRYNQLYTAYSWMNAAFALPGGYMIDRIGSRISAVLVTSVAAVGTVLFGVSSLDGIRGTHVMFPLMICGRLLLGAGTGSALRDIMTGATCGAGDAHSSGTPDLAFGFCEVVQDRVVAFWFKDRVSFAYGFVIFGLRVGNVSNFLLTANVANKYGIQWAFWLGSLMCLVGVISAVCLALLDYHGTKRLDDDAKINMKAMPVSRRDIASFPASYWAVCFMIMSYYACYLPFVGNGSKYIQDRYGYSKTASSYINGAVYDTSVLVSPFVGSLLGFLDCNGMVLLVTCVLTLPIFPLLAFIPELYPIILTIWIGLGYTFAAVCLWPCIIIVVPKKAVGTAVGMATFIQGLGIGLTNLATGKILGFSEDPNMSSRIHKYQVMLLMLLGLVVLSTLCAVAVNVFDLRKGRLLNRRLAKKNTRTSLDDVIDEKSPLVSDGPLVQSYVSIDASTGYPTAHSPGIQ